MGIALDIPDYDGLFLDDLGELDLGDLPGYITQTPEGCMIFIPGRTREEIYS